MQDRGMQVVHVNSMLRCIEAKVIAFTKRNARLNATSRQPHREAIRVMVATIVAAPLHHRRAAELTAPDNERIVQKSALLEVLNQCRAGLVRVLAVVSNVVHKVAVLVPGFMKNLDETH